MAAAITTTAATLEGQLLEVARELELAEQAASLNNITIALNVDNKTTTITARLPLTISGSGESLTLSAAEYITS